MKLSGVIPTGHDSSGLTNGQKGREPRATVRYAAVSGLEIQPKGWWQQIMGFCRFAASGTIGILSAATVSAIHAAYNQHKNDQLAAQLQAVTGGTVTYYMVTDTAENATTEAATANTTANTTANITENITANITENITENATGNTARPADGWRPPGVLSVEEFQQGKDRCLKELGNEGWHQGLCQAIFVDPLRQAMFCSGSARDYAACFGKQPSERVTPPDCPNANVNGTYTDTYSRQTGTVDYDSTDSTNFTDSPPGTAGQQTIIREGVIESVERAALEAIASATIALVTSKISNWFIGWCVSKKEVGIHVDEEHRAGVESSKAPVILDSGFGEGKDNDGPGSPMLTEIKEDGVNQDKGGGLSEWGAPVSLDQAGGSEENTEQKPRRESGSYPDSEEACARLSGGTNG